MTVIAGLIVAIVVAFLLEQRAPDTPAASGGKAAAACQTLADADDRWDAREAAALAREAAVQDVAWDRLSLRIAAYVVGGDEVDRREALQLCGDWGLLQAREH